MVVAKKKPTKRRTTTRRKKSAGFNFYCYRVAHGMTLAFFPTREEGLEFASFHEFPDESVRRVAVKSNEDLAKILREHTI